jgi:hypothetical protein
VPVVEASRLVKLFHTCNHWEGGGGGDAIPVDGGSDFGPVMRRLEMEGPCAFPENITPIMFLSTPRGSRLDHEYHRGAGLPNWQLCGATKLATWIAFMIIGVVLDHAPEDR